MAIGFHAFTIKYNGTADRIITELNLSQAFGPDNVPSPPPPLISTSALWDTGATRSVITPSLAKHLGVMPTGTAMLQSAHEIKPCNTYLVNLYLPNKVLIPGVLVNECADTANFGAVIGMDIIASGDFSITNVNGKTWISFRIPSINGIDYVAEAEKIEAERTKKVLIPRVGRNDPCPCGSGKKYKKCCGAPS